MSQMFTTLRASLLRTAATFSISERLPTSAVGIARRCQCDTTDKQEPSGESQEKDLEEGTAPEASFIEESGKEDGEQEPEISYYEAWHERGRYPSRAEIGNYSDPGTLDREMLLDWEAKGDGPRGTRLYDLPRWLRHNMPENAPRPRIKGLLAEALKDEEIKALHDYFTLQEKNNREKNEPSIFKWEIQFVLSVGGEDHPANRKVKLRVYMKELQEYYGLDDDAVQHICKICQKRYVPTSGLLTLSVEKYPHREDNRRECMRIIEQLVMEGMKKSPGLEESQIVEGEFTDGMFNAEESQSATA